MFSFGFATGSVYASRDAILRSPPFTYPIAQRRLHWACPVGLCDALGLRAGGWDPLWVLRFGWLLCCWYNGVFKQQINKQISILPQQRELMGSSARNSSGVHWCRRRVRFNRVRRSGRFWCRTRSRSTGLPRRFQEALVESQVRFNRVPEKVPGRLWCRGRSQGSGEGSRF